MASPEQGSLLSSEAIWDHFKCPICFQQFEEPMILECHHSFCKNCLQKCIDLKKKQSELEWDQMIECPKCRAKTEVSKGVRADFRTASLMSDMMSVQAPDTPVLCGVCDEEVAEVAEAFCYACNVGLCNFCVKSHKRQTTIYPDHSVVRLEDIGNAERRAAERRFSTQSFKCKEHKSEMLNYFCIACDKLVCNACLLMSHKDHERSYINDEVTEKQTEVIQEAYKPVEDRLAEIAEVCRSFEETRAKLKADYETLVGEIQSAHRERVRDLQDRETLLKSRAENLLTSTDKTLAMNLDGCQKTKEDMEAAMQHLKEFIPSSSNYELLSNKKQLVAKAQSLHHACEKLEKPVKGSDDIETQYTFVCSPSLNVDGVGRIVRKLHNCKVAELEVVTQGKVMTVDISALDVCGKQLPDKQLPDGEAQCSASLLPPHDDVHCVVTNNRSGKYVVRCQPLFHGHAEMDITLESDPARHRVPIDVVRSYAPFFPEPDEIPLECSPWSVAVVPGNMLAVSMSDKQVKLYDINAGAFTRDIQAPFVRPYAMAVDNRNNLWVTDREAHNIRQFSLEGEIMRKYGTKGSGQGYFLHPRGIAIHPDSGRIYVADMRNHRIQILRCSEESEGQLVFVDSFGHEGKEKGELNQPAGILFNKEGHLVVCDDRNCRLQVFSAEGQHIQNMGVSDKDKGLLCSAIGVAMDAHGRYIVSEFGCHCITFLSREGRILGSLRSAGAGVGELVHPRGVAVDEKGYIYVADFENQRIVRV